VPPIDGFDSVDYLTSTEALYLRDRPESLVVMGGGYIAVEMEPTLVPREDEDVSETFTDLVRERHDVYTGHRATSVAPEGGEIAVTAETEQALREAGTEYVVRRQSIPGMPLGRAKKLEEGFVKALAAPDGEILGCHIIGHEATTMIHEVVVAMRSAGGSVSDVTGSIHAHPTLNKAVEYAFEALA